MTRLSNHPGASADGPVERLVTANRRRACRVEDGVTRRHRAPHYFALIATAIAAVLPAVAAQPEQEIA